MRKLFALVVALCLALTFTASAEVAMMEYDFGDFTMTMPADIIVETYEKVDNQVYFFLYQPMPAGVTTQNSLNCVWSAGFEDITSIDPVAFGETIVSTLPEQYAAQGIIASNATLIHAESGEQDGKPCLSMIYSTDLDYSPLGIDLQVTLFSVQGIVSDIVRGTYSFTVGTDNIDSALPLLEAMNTVTWK